MIAVTEATLALTLTVRVQADDATREQLSALLATPEARTGLARTLENMLRLSPTASPTFGWIDDNHDAYIAELLEVTAEPDTITPDDDEAA